MLRQLNDDARRGGNRSGITGLDGEPSSPYATPSRGGRQVLQSPDGKVAAVIVNGALTKTVSGSLHFLRNPRAIALDAGAVNTANAQGVKQITVTDRETGSVYHTSLTDLLNFGWLFNRGYGWQLAMRLDRWQRDGQAVQPEPLPAPTPPADRGALQLALL